MLPIKLGQFVNSIFFFKALSFAKQQPVAKPVNCTYCTVVFNNKPVNIKKIMAKSFDQENKLPPRALVMSYNDTAC